MQKFRTLCIACLPVSMFLTSTSAYATTYDAYCGKKVKCQITLTAQGFSAPAGFMPQGLIAKWYSGGTEDFNWAKGTAGSLGAGTAGAAGGSVLLGPIGLLGGLVGGAIHGSKAGKELDLFYTVVGYNTRGEQFSQNFYFINKKPAAKISMELPMLTGLAMGQERSKEDLKAAFKNIRAPLPTKELLPSKLGN